MDRPHHGDVGFALRCDRLLHRPLEFPDHAVLAWPRRGRAVSGADPVLHLLVPALASRPYHGGIHRGAAACGRRRRSAVDGSPRTQRRVRHCRMEVDVHRRGGADRARRYLLSVLRDGSPGPRALAPRRGAHMVDRDARGGTQADRVEAQGQLVAVVLGAQGADPDAELFRHRHRQPWLCCCSCRRW